MYTVLCKQASSFDYIQSKMETLCNCTIFSETWFLLLSYCAASLRGGSRHKLESFQEPFSSSWIFIFIRASSPHHTPLLIPVNTERMCKNGCWGRQHDGMRLRERRNIEWVTELGRTGWAWTRLWRTHWSHCLLQQRVPRTDTAIWNTGEYKDNSKGTVFNSFYVFTSVQFLLT